jgi:MFS family permease
VSTVKPAAALDPPLLALSRDGWLLFTTCAVRSLAYGFLSVMLGVYLGAVGLSTTAIGWIFTAALAGGALMTVAITSVADRFGRRALLVGGALLMAAAGAVFVFSRDPAWLALAAALGAMSPSGKEVGPFLALEQAVLPQTTDDRQRTAVFAAYNLIGSFAGAVGALAVGIPQIFSLDALAGHRLLLWIYTGLALLLTGLFLMLSPAVEASKSTVTRARGVRKSRPMVAKLAGLFALDACAGGFIVQGLLAYWFHVRYGIDGALLGGIFFATNFLAALSFLAAPALARRFGLLNTMVFTHLPSNVLLLIVPFMPTARAAILVLLLRHLLSQMDVPTRQSYTMAVVEPGERAAAAGILSVARNVGASIAPLFAGATLAAPALGLPFLLAGGLKIVYDIWIYLEFRGVKPPEEASTERSVEAKAAGTGGAAKAKLR